MDFPDEAVGLRVDFPGWDIGIGPDGQWAASSPHGEVTADTPDGLRQSMAAAEDDGDD